MSGKIIGTVTTYHGDEHRYLKGYKVRIVAVLKNAAKPDIDVDGPEYANIDDEEELRSVGGVTADDRIEVQPWLKEEGRFSFVTSDPKATDLTCFENIYRRFRKDKKKQKDPFTPRVRFNWGYHDARADRERGRLRDPHDLKHVLKPYDRNI